MRHRSSAPVLLLAAALTSACAVDDEPDDDRSPRPAPGSPETPPEVDEPPGLAWPAGPGAAATSSRCTIDGGRGLATYVPTAGTLSLTPRPDGTLRVVTTGWITDGAAPRGRMTSHVSPLPWEVPGTVFGGGYNDDVVTSADEELLPFATRGDVNVHVHEGDVIELRARVLALDEEQQSLRSETNRWHELPADRGGIQALALVADRMALLAHGTTTDVRFSTARFGQEPPYFAPIVADVAIPRSCADRPVVVSLATGSAHTVVAVSTDGSACDGAPGAPDAARTAVLDEEGALVAHEVVSVGGVVEEMWTTTTDDVTWLVLRLEGESALRLARVGADAVVEPVAIVDAEDAVAVTAWRDGLALADVVATGETRLRLVSGAGAIVEPGTVVSRDGTVGRPALVASPDGRTILVGGFELRVVPVQDAEGPMVQLTYVNCAL